MVIKKCGLIWAQKRNFEKLPKIKIKESSF